MACSARALAEAGAIVSPRAEELALSNGLQVSAGQLLVSLRSSGHVYAVLGFSSVTYIYIYQLR